MKKNSNSIDDILSKASMCYASTNEQKKEDAFALFQKVLELDPTNLRAINGVGNCYKNGFGVEKDYDKAIDYYKKAAKLNYPLGQFMLARTLEEIGDPEYLQWDEILSATSSAEVQYVIGQLYYEGIEVQKDEQKAMLWWRRASDRGHKKAQENMELLYLDKPIKEEKQSVVIGKKVSMRILLYGTLFLVVVAGTILLRHYSGLPNNNPEISESAIIPSEDKPDKDAKTPPIEDKQSEPSKEKAKTTSESQKTPTPKPTSTSTPTPKPTSTSTPTPKPTSTSTPTPKPTSTSTPTPEPTSTSTPTPEPTSTSTPTPEPTSTSTPAPEPTSTSTPAPEPTVATEQTISE